MHLLLTDRLTCPRCGPRFGLILLARRLEERRVHEGELGCPNCRDSFPVVQGFADLRAPPRGELPTGLVGLPDEGVRDHGDESGRLSALLGIVGGPGAIALVGEPARHARALAESLEDSQIVAVDPDLVDWPDVPRVSRMVGGPGLPLFSRTTRGVVVDGRLGEAWLREAIRVIAPRGRVVVTRAPEGAARTLEEGDLEVLASEAETIVAARG